MNSEIPLPKPEREFQMASETEKDIPEILRSIHEKKAEFLDRGVFFDVYAIEEDKESKDDGLVFKNFRCGDTLMSTDEQASLFQHQYYEWTYLLSRLGEEFFPESYWIRSAGISDDQAHEFFADPGKTANTMKEFLTVQLDRQMANRYNADDKRRSTLKKLIGQIGEKFGAQKSKSQFIGAIVQQKIDGVPFSEALQKIESGNARSEDFRDNAQQLVRRLREYHDESDYAAFTWHSLESTNVVAETDENDELTGRIFVLDANFIERPNKTFKGAVIDKLEKNVLQKIEKALE